MDEGGDDSALDVLLCTLSEKGYDTQAFKVNATDYGLPQSRTRLFFMGMRRPGRALTIRDYDLFFKHVGRFLDIFKMKCPSILDVLLPDSHPWVARELERRQGRPAKGWDSSSISIHRVEWQKQGLRWQAVQAAAEDSSSPWFETLCARQRDNLAFHQVKNKGADAASSGRLMGADLGQSISRISSTTRARTGQIVAPTLLPGSFLWLSSRTPTRAPRPLLGVEALSAQGWPALQTRWKDMVGEQPSAFLANLAGNAFPGTVVMALVCALVFAAEVHERRPGTAEDNDIATSAEDVLAACTLLESSAVSGQ